MASEQILGDAREEVKTCQARHGCGGKEMAVGLRGWEIWGQQADMKVWNKGDDRKV